MMNQIYCPSEMVRLPDKGPDYDEYSHPSTSNVDLLILWTAKPLFNSPSLFHTNISLTLPQMPYTLEALPYAMDALEPFISKETLEYHYGKHHQGYVTKLNGLLTDHSAPLTSLLTAQGTSTAVYNNAAQIWNHTFYWKCMTAAAKQPAIPKQLETLLIKNFGTVDDFKKKFETCAAGHFGSGWVWLVQGEEKGSLQIMDTHDAYNPLTKGLNPLLVLDVWEHAYYIDKRNNRLAYIQEWFKLINWDFVAQNIQESKL